MRNRPTHTAFPYLLTVPLLLAAIPAHAAEDAAGDASALNEITVSATKLDVTQAQMTQASTVIPADQIAVQAQSSMTEVLRQVPGAQFSVGGAPGQFIYPRLRGFPDGSGAILYTFDGIILNGAGSGGIQYLLGQLDPTMVQDIQVLRGPHATTYGANSTAGVIAFNTLEGDHQEEDLAVEGGSLGTYKLRAGAQNSLSAGGGTWKYSLNGSWFDSNGVNDHEYTRNGTLVGRTSFSSDGIEVGGSFYLTDNKFQSANLIESAPLSYGLAPASAPYFGVQIPDPSNVDTTKAGIVSLWFKQQLTGNLSQKLTVGGSGQDLTTVDGDTPNGNLLGSYRAPYDGWTPDYGYTFYNAGDSVPVYQSPYAYKTINNDYQADYNLNYHTDRVSAVAGATYLTQYYNESYTAYGSTSGGSEHQSTRSIYANASVGWFNNSLHTEAGARLDSYTAWRNKATWSAGLVYDLVPGLSLYANYGTSFTQPTLDDLYDPIYGNKNVTPENASTIEGGIRIRELDGALTAAVSYWHSYLDNVILFDYNLYNPRIPNSDGSFGGYGEYGNGDAARTQGYEAEFSWKLSTHLTLSGNYTYTDSHTQSGGIWTQSVENSRNTGNLGLTWSQAQFDAGANLYAADHRLRWAGDYWAPGYARLDLFGRWHATSTLDLYGRIQNALDKDIVEVLGYRNPGVYFIVGAKYSFH